jgi:hypothetical protein
MFWSATESRWVVCGPHHSETSGATHPASHRTTMESSITRLWEVQPRSNCYCLHIQGVCLFYCVRQSGSCHDMSRAVLHLQATKLPARDNHKRNTLNLIILRDRLWRMSSCTGTQEAVDIQGQKHMPYPLAFCLSHDTRYLAMQETADLRAGRRLFQLLLDCHPPVNQKVKIKFTLEQAMTSRRQMGWVVNATPLPLYLRKTYPVRYPLYRRQGGPQGHSGWVRKNHTRHRNSIPGPSKP